MYGLAPGFSSAVTSWSGVIDLRRMNVAGLELVGEVVLDREQDERPPVGQEALGLEALGDRRAVSPRADRERDLLACRSTRGR